MKKRMVVLSLDALGAEDEKRTEKCKNIRSIIEGGIFFPRVESVFPTLTYPAHATLLTGRYPASHGIVNNIRLQPDREKPDWYWYAKDIKGDTLFKACRREKKKVGAIFWPVSAGAHIHWNMAEIWPHRRFQNQTMVSMLNSTMPFAFQGAKKYGNLLAGIRQPNLDDFAAALAVDLIRNKPFDCLFVHFTDIDAHKHQYGIHHEEVDASFLRTDRRVGEVIQALDEVGILSDTDIVLLSDHSQREIRNALRLNQIFYRHGILEAQGGRVTRWQAYANSCEGSCYVYVKDDDPEFIAFVGRLLQDIKNNIGGIDRIYTREEIIALGGDLQCAFHLTADSKCVFSNSLEGEVFGTMDNDYRANHGYPPTLRNYEAMFAAKGPSFHSGRIETSTIPMVEIAPTLAEALEVKLRGAEGRARTEYLK